MKRILAVVSLLGIVTMGMAQEKPADENPVLKFYGFFKVDAAFNSAQFDNYHSPSIVKPDSITNRDDNSSLTTRFSRLGLFVTAPKIDGISIKGQFEMDFMAGASETSAPLRVRLANIDLGFESGFSVKAGQCWDLISPLAPMTLNPQTGGAYGSPGLRHQQIQLSQKAGSFLFQAGAIRQEGSESEVLPAWQARISATAPVFGEKSAPLIVGFSGLYGKIAGDDEAYLLSFEYQIPILPVFRWRGEMNLAKNAGVYSANIGQAKGEGGGFWSSFEFDASQQIMLWTGAMMDMFNDSTIEGLANGAIEKNMAVLLGVKYQITKSTMVALEGAYHKTSYKTIGDADAIRGMLTLQMNF